MTEDVAYVIISVTEIDKHRLDTDRILYSTVTCLTIPMSFLGR